VPSWLSNAAQTFNRSKLLVNRLGLHDDGHGSGRWPDMVICSRYGSERTGRDEPHDVRHFKPIQDSGYDVLSLVVASSCDRIADETDAAASENGTDARVQGRCHERDRAAR